MQIMNGKFYLRALSYALAALPKNKATGARLQHISFIGDQVIGADGERWHCGMLGEDVDLAPTVVAEQSARSLEMALTYALRMSNRVSGDFTVKQDGERVIIEYGASHPIEHVFALVDHGPGKLPTKWRPPVAPNAPILADQRNDLRCGHMLAAMSWYRSWEKDHGSFTMRGVGGGSPVRIDISSDGEVVATAYLLPIDHPQAQLPPDEPLLARGQKPKSQTNLDLIVGATIDEVEVTTGIVGEEPPPAKPKRGRKPKAKKPAQAEAQE